MNFNLDTTTVATYSLMIYFVPKVAAGTASIQDFVNHQMAKLNQGYINSKIPVRAKLHCLQKIVMNETLDAKWHEEIDKIKLPSNGADGVTVFGKPKAVY